MFINNKKVLPNNNIIIYNKIPCVVLRYNEGKEGDNPIAEVSYKNELKIIYYTINYYPAIWLSTPYFEMC